MIDITIKNVAKEAGVSTATVSRVINGVSGVRPSTIKKVNDAIARINYVPNAVARNLKTEKTNTIGLLVSNISNSHFTFMAKTIEQILRDEGYIVIFCSTDDRADMELKYLQRLMSLRVDGLILNTTGQNDDYVAGLSNMLPIVLVDRYIHNHKFFGDFVGSNNFDGMKTMTRHLVDLGHRKIGIITSNLLASTGRERLRGFQAAMQNIGVCVDDNYPYRYDSSFFNIEGGMDGSKYLMSLEDKPTAIAVINNDMAIGVYKYLYANHISVPEEVSIVSYGNIENSELFCIEPTYVTLNPHFIGEKAGQYLLSRINNRSLGNREVIYESTLYIHDSTKKL